MIKLFIVDDYDADIYLTKEALSDLDIKFQITTCYNGEDVVKELSNGNIPHIILLDIKMPKMNGIETLKYIKDNFKNVCVIMLTTSDHAQEVLEAYNLKADGYIVKPLYPDDFKKRINTFKNIFIDKDLEFVNFRKGER